VNGAKAYVKKVGAEKLELTMMMVSLFAKAQPKYLDEWEKLTGIRIKTIEYGYTEIPAKIMADAVARSGAYDIYNHQMYMLPDARTAFRAKFGREPGCPDTWKQWEEMASFFNGKKGQTFYGMALEKDLYGAQEYRAREFGYRWWQGRYASKNKLMFDRNMKPLIDGPEGVETTREMVLLTKHMPQDIFGWGTPQNYPFFAQGNSFSIATFPSV